MYYVNPIFNSAIKNAFGYENTSGMMRSNIKKEDDNYVVEIEMPGIKEQISLSLKNGYLKVGVDNKKAEEQATYILHERYEGSYSRSYYLGDQFVEEDIKASLQDGILRLVFPQVKKQEKKVIPIN